MRIKNYLTDSKRAGIRRAFQWVVIHGREFQEKEFLYRILPAESRDRLVQRNYYMHELTKAFRFNLLRLAGLLSSVKPPSAANRCELPWRRVSRVQGICRATDTNYYTDRMIEDLSR